MNLFLKKILIISVVLVLFLSEIAYGTVYIYEVTTATKRFQTASKLQPDAFRMYHGGYDIIYELKLVTTYKDEDMRQAMRDYKLEKNNSNVLIFNAVPRNVPRLPYYWWR